MIKSIVMALTVSLCISSVASAKTLHFKAIKIHAKRPTMVKVDRAFAGSRQACETVGPRVDGLRVTICAGHVVSMTDASGYTLAYPSN